LHGKEEPVHKSQLVEWRRDDILVTFASQKMTLTVTTPDHQVHCTMLNSVLELHIHVAPIKDIRQRLQVENNAQCLTCTQCTTLIQAWMIVPYRHEFLNVLDQLERSFDTTSEELLADQ
jgi:hypothetical protein